LSEIEDDSILTNIITKICNFIWFCYSYWLWCPVVLPNQYNKSFSIRNVIKGEIPDNATCNGVTLQIDRKASHTDII
jgi:hypothetical protein